MKKKGLLITLLLIIIVVLSILGYNFYQKYRIEHAVKIVVLERDELNVFEDVHLKDIIKEINGNLINNKKIDTSKVGDLEISFEYITDEKIKVPYTINIKVSDKEKPFISKPSYYTVGVGEMTKEELEIEFFCGDNYDDNPKCTLEGDYDLTIPGNYQVTLKAEDSSNNINEHSFTLRVIERQKSSSKGNSNTGAYNYTDYNDIIKKYKTENTKIGIDISHWQGTIDFKKIKENGVEFAYIRVGRGNGIGKEYILDDKFKEYIKGFNKENIPVGIYFYSYANSEEDAIKEAKWVLKQIKNYEVDLEIVFDWENWSDFQEYDLSFYRLSKAADAFIKTVEKAGYKGMNYSSKYYLENIWFKSNSPIWLAHYTEQTNYEGEYKVWQLCNDGKVEGIDDNLVDIDIMYK